MKIPAADPDRRSGKIQNDLLELLLKGRLLSSVIDQNIAMLRGQSFHGQKNLMEVMIHSRLLIADSPVYDPYF